MSKIIKSTIRAVKVRVGFNKFMEKIINIHTKNDMNIESMNKLSVVINSAINDFVIDGSEVDHILIWDPNSKMVNIQYKEKTGKGNSSVLMVEEFCE